MKKSTSFGSEYEYPGETLERVVYIKLTNAMWEQMKVRARERGFRTGQDYIRWLVYEDMQNNMLHMDTALHTFATWLGDTIGAAAGKVIFEAERAFIDQDTSMSDSYLPKTKTVYKQKGK